MRVCIRSFALGRVLFLESFASCGLIVLVAIGCRDTAAQDAAQKNPSMLQEILRRADQNGNGLLEINERIGTTKFLVDTLVRNQPNLDLSKPISITLLVAQGRAEEPTAIPLPSSVDSEIMNLVDDESTPSNSKLLVPGFESRKQSKSTVPGFGAKSEKFSVTLEETDLQEAKDRIRRFDVNRNDRLDRDELSRGSWVDDPMRFDQNNDGELSILEIATRQALVRNAKKSRTTTTTNGLSSPPPFNSKGDGKKDRPIDFFQNQSSYRKTPDQEKNSLRNKMPEWFRANDIDLDDQVSMREFLRRLDQASVEDFYRFDANQDGYIVVRECLQATKLGLSPRYLSDPTLANLGAISPAAIPPEGSVVRASYSATELKKLNVWMVKKFARMDRDKNGSLSDNEYLEAPFETVDENRDGKISFEEYSAFRSR